MSPRTQRLTQARFDFRGGLNVSYAQDVLDYRELRKARNARVGEIGTMAKRTGTQRVHNSEIGLGEPVLGLYQWKPEVDVRELVAICGGNLYHKVQADSNFTEEVGSFSTSVRPGFSPHIIAGVPTLYIADGMLRSWDGLAISAVADAPAGLLRVAVYKTRMFGIDGTKTVYWSKISDPEVWASPNGGQANVETYGAEGLLALEKVGASLLLFKENSIARFSGVDAANIRIDQETQGISADIGAIAPGTVIRVESQVFFVTDRGPYFASEAGVIPAGVKVERAFDDAEMDNLPYAVAVHHKVRKEVWVFFPENEETTNNVGYCLNYRTNTWTGPWDMGGTFDVCSAAEYELTTKRENVVLGGYDGFVRQGDVPALAALDDVLRNGTGGAAITMDLELPTLLFGDPTAVKRFNGKQSIAADLKEDGALVVTMQGDEFTARSRSLPSRGTGVKQYNFRPAVQGERVTVNIVDASEELVQVNGVSLDGARTRRVI